MNISRLSLPVLNLSLRSASLGARFVLTLFMAKFLTLEEIGLFGLFFSATSAGPAVLGLGMNFFLNRELINRTEAIRLNLLRDRLLVSALTASIVSIVALVMTAIFFNEYLNYFYIFFFIFVIEVVCLDLHFSLLILKKPLQANYLLFIRSALWVLPFVLISYIEPGFRNLLTLMVFWLAGLVLSVIATLGLIKDWKWSSYRGAKFEISWFKEVVLKNKLVYAAELGFAGTMFADRFVLGAASSLHQVGVFVFFWTVANAVQVLSSSAVSQLALPYMIEAFKKNGVGGVRNIIRKKSINAFVLASALSLVAFLTIYEFMPLIDRPELVTNLHLLTLLLLSTTVRSISDVWSAGLYSVCYDKIWAYTNILGFIGSLVFSYIGILNFGLTGVAVGALLVSIFQLIGRAYFFELLVRKSS